MLHPIDILDDVDRQYPCRRLQAKQLVFLLAPDAPTLPGVVVHGLTATCKSAILTLVLQRLGKLHAIVKSKECITGRHLLERTVATCLDAIDDELYEKIDRVPYAKCENASALTVHLQQLLRERRKFVLVFDGIDRQREAPSTLLPALARLNEFIPNLTVVFVVTSPRQRFLHRVGIPYVYFPSYKRDETLQILSRSPLPIFADREPNAEASTITGLTASETSEADNDSKWLWARFCAAVYDSQGKNSARDLANMRELAEKLWRPFVALIVDGSLTVRDFSKLMVANRSLFQNEELLAHRITLPYAASTTPGIATFPGPATGDNLPSKATSTTPVVPRSKSRIDLPYYAKFLLCAAYLASFNPPRTDAAIFMRSSEKKRRRRRRRRQNLNQLTLVANSDPFSSAAMNKGGNTDTEKHRKIPRRLLTPSAFPLERLLALFHALVPHEVRTGVDVCTQLATLVSLKMVVRAGGGGGGGGDVLDPGGARWRVNVRWEYLVVLARSVGLDMAELAFEA